MHTVDETAIERGGLAHGSINWNANNALKKDKLLYVHISLQRGIFIA